MNIIIKRILTNVSKLDCLHLRNKAKWIISQCKSKINQLTGLAQSAFKTYNNN